MQSSHSASNELFTGHSELSWLMREYAWAETSLGLVETWPQSLKTSIRIMMTSRQPIWIGWGEDLIYFYNDPYKSIIGGKHPWALGKPIKEVWQELWRDIGPMLATAMRGSEGTYVEEQLLIMERNGYPEETYYTFSYSPIPDDDGNAGGIICANTDDTQRVIGERQLALLRNLAALTTSTKSWQAACEQSLLGLSTNPRDVPFAALYIKDSENENFILAGSCGIEQTHPAIPKEMAAGSSPWPIEELMVRQEAIVVEMPLDQFSVALPGGVWEQSPKQVAILPITATGETGGVGMLLVGLNPFRLFDENYRGFLELAAGQIAAAIASAQAYEEQRKRAEALAEIDKAKTLFFSNVSHEFRTPLTLMLGPLEQVLHNQNLSGDVRMDLEIIHRNGLRLLRLVNSLLDFSRVEAGRTSATYTRVDLATLTADLSSNFRSLCEQAGLALIVDCQPLPEPVYIDRDMWEKIVFNLLSNAYKFTLNGSIFVTLRADEGYAKLEIKDTGIGIPNEELPRIFERFHRIETSKGRSHEGTGIGLALVKQLVKLHGGTIEVWSEYEFGTSFRIRIPMGATHLPPDHVGTAPGQPSTATRAEAFVEEALRWSSGENLATKRPSLPPIGIAPLEKRILLADDNADMRNYVERILQENYAVISVADGQAALEAALLHRPNLILTDVMMPHLDGFGLLREVRLRKDLRDIPVILLSARAGQEAEIEGLEAGADDYLIKPFSARDLTARVNALLIKHEVRKEGELRLKANEAALREADRRKDEFLATLAHELRNPLAPLSNALEIMQIAQDSKSQLEMQALIRRQLTQMIRLVDDLMDVSRITRGKVDLRREKLSLAKVIENALEMVQPLFNERNQRLVIHPLDQNVWLHADFTRLSQVFSNILNNAAKYTPEQGAIELTITKQDAVAIVTIRDNGIGIPSDKLHAIFEMFLQIENPMGRTQSGLGIGLTLAEQLVQLHGGKVTAESAGLGMGSCFAVHLPLLPSEPADETAYKTINTISTAVLRVLVVDDNQESAMTLGKLIELLGHEVSTTHDGLSALKTAETFLPDMVLLDIGLPDINGFDVCKRMRLLPSLQKAIFVAQTGWGEQRHHALSRDAGFDHHLVKPIDFELLRSLLDRLGNQRALG
jgi:signal transduction histidine kinase